jgi:KipI family sensor histidine kinase inhibitor
VIAAETVRLLWLGDRAVTLELPRADSARVFGLAAALEAGLAAGKWPGASEVLPALRSVTLFFDPLIAEPEKWQDELRALAESAPSSVGSGRHWTVPVCFAAEFAPDLEKLAENGGLTRKQFIDLLTAGEVSVRMLGFLPGFAYLGELPEACRAPRLATPRTRVPAGSLAIAGAYCALYPWDSPGGWNLVGRTPIRLFDAANAAHPALFEAGDRIAWQIIDRGQFDRWPDQ